jgi:hypothetical protein
MKLIPVLGLLVLFQIGRSQSVDSSNYYEKMTHAGTLNWLRVSEAVPIIIDELEKNGYGYSGIDIGRLMRIDSFQYLVITVSYGDQFGFIFRQGHGIPVKRSDRYYYSHDDQSQFQYVQVESELDTAYRYIQVKKIPRNIFLLDERCYWYEFDTSGKNSFPVSKEVISNILRADIRERLKHVGGK